MPVQYSGASLGYPLDALEARERERGQVQANNKRHLIHCGFGDYAGQAFHVVKKASEGNGRSGLHTFSNEWNGKRAASSKRDG